MSSDQYLRIGIDARTLNIKGGSQNYAKELISQLETNEGIEIVKYGNKKSWLFDKIQETPLRLIWENLILPFKIQRSDIDVFHGLKNTAPLITETPKVMTVHDLGPLKDFESSLKEAIYIKIWKHYVKSADHVVAISESTKKDLQKHWKIPEDRISVIYHGANYEELENTSKDIPKYKIRKGENIILSVGTVKPRKNYKNLIKGFKKALEEIDAKLLIAGKKSHRAEKIIATAEEQNIEDKVNFLGYVPEEDLKELYSRADLFALFSKYEGFCLPILEAMACGTPVITSNTSSLPEVVGDAGITVDPENPKQLAKQIEKVQKNPKIQKEMKEKGKKRAEKFSWKKTAKQTVEVYKEVLG